MSKSEELKKEYLSEDNDFKAMGIYKKLNRETKLEKFKEVYLPLLAKKVKVVYEGNIPKYTIISETWGVIDFFPKANKILIRKDNQWKNKGLYLLITMFDLKIEKEC